MADERKRPPYLRYAFQNPYNYAVMGGFASAAVLTGNWWLGLAGAGAEALWMLFAPDSRLLRTLWFDKVHASELEARAQAVLAEKLRALPSERQLRAYALIEKKQQIDRLAQENPAFTTELLSGELGKLESLVQSFIELQITCAKYEDHLRSVSLNEIEQDLRRYQQIVDRAADTDKRALAQKNLAVVQKRMEKYKELKGYVSSTQGQLELIENTFRLLADQIVSMRSPTELGGQLDELIDGVEAVRQTTRETDRLLQPAAREELR